MNQISQNYTESNGFTFRGSHGTKIYLYIHPSDLPISLFIRNFEFFVNMFISHDILFHVLDYLCDAHALTFLRYFGSIKFARDIIILLRNDILTILRRKHLLVTGKYIFIRRAPRQFYTCHMTSRFYLPYDRARHLAS